MRIIAGRLKGRRLRAPVPPGLRPTADGLRETLFNVLGSSIEGARVLDAYAGTGAVGLEAWSRGAASVTFVERDPRAVAVITENVQHCGTTEACAIIRGDFLTWAARSDAGGSTARPPDDRFDLVWLDPPYDVAGLDEILRAAANQVGDAGRIVIEHSRRRPAPEPPAAFARTRTLVAGDSALSFFAPPGATTRDD